MDEQMLEVLKDIRSEAKQTNVRLGSLEGRFESLEATTNAHFESLEATTNAHFESLEATTNAHFESLEATTNAHFESLEATTNTRFESLEGRFDRVEARMQLWEGRFDFFEKRVIRGFENVNETLERHVERIDELSRRQVETELRLDAHITTMSQAIRDVRDLLAANLDDHRMVADHEERIRSLEERIADKDEER